MYTIDNNHKITDLPYGGKQMAWKIKHHWTNTLIRLLSLSYSAHLYIFEANQVDNSQTRNCPVLYCPCHLPSSHDQLTIDFFISRMYCFSDRSVSDI